MELRHLRYFVAVAEELNFTRAAARIGINQPPLSQQIRDLETEIGTALFHRVPHGAELTEAGHVFLKEARVILGQGERAKRYALRAGEGATGLLRAGFTSSALFNPAGLDLIRGFRRTWPDVTLAIEEGNSIHLVERVLNQELDAALVRPSSAFPGGLSVHAISRERLMLALPDGHPLTPRPVIAMGDLALEPFVMFSRAVGVSFPDTVQAACREAGFEPIIALEAPQIASILNLVAAEFGIALVPTSIARVQVKGVVYRAISGNAPVVTLSLATRQTDKTAVVRNLIDIARLALPVTVDQGPGEG
jgi:DNA-binding transcriptional LysR family regulator